MATGTVFIVHLIQEEGDHSHMHGREIPRLVNGDKDHVISGRYLEIGRFWRLDADREKDRTATGCGNAEIRLSLCNIVHHVFGDPDIIG
jgi:hypothetical protein